MYITGASFDPGSSSFDYVTIMYDDAGIQQWATRYDGDGSDIDIPVAVKVDGYGNIFVTGMSVGTNLDMDYATICYDPGGTELWASRYNYAGGDDRAGGLEVAPTGEIIVVGVSLDSTGNNQYAYLQYDENDGSTLIEERKNLPGIALEKPAAIAQDNYGNFYLTGSVANGTHYDMYTAKLDDSLQVDWEATYDGDSLNDEPNAIGVDTAGNVFVTGYTEDSNGKQFVTIKYDPNGDDLWVRTESSSNGNAEATDLQITLDDKIYVTGSRPVGSTISVYTVCYDQAGEKQWEQFSDDEEEAEDVQADLYGNVFVTGRSFANGNYSYLALKYSTYQRIQTAVNDTNGNPLYITDEVIIHFDPDSLIRTKIDKREIKFGRLGNFISAEFIADIENKLDLSGQLANAVTLKVYQELTPDDSICVSWRGDTLKIPPFWASLVVKIPTSNQESVTPDILATCDSLETLFPAIRYANPNVIASLASNDSIFSEQNSLHGLDSLTSNGKINVDDLTAWAQYPQRGRSDVIVGVFDTGIDWKHEDFMIDTTGDFNDSKVIAGKDYAGNTGPIGQSNNPYSSSHGTLVSGIIGALTDNMIGIAGIAGGDMDGIPANPGVSLVSMQINTNATLGSLDKIANAIYEGTKGTNGIPKLHIMNHSWRVLVGEDYLEELEFAIRFAFRNQIITIAARGNEGDNGSPLAFPACFRDDWALTIGASNEKGFYHDAINGDEGDLAASIGGNIDLVAPGSSFTIRSTSPNNAYESFNNTSAATPHVSGVVGLMMSFCKEQNGQPTPTLEDVEWMLEESAKDIVKFPADVGYDDHTGFGLLNGDKALEFVNKSFFDLVHLEDTSTLIDTIYTGINLLLHKNYGPLPGGVGNIYNVDVIKVEKSFTFGFGNRQLAHLAFPG